MLTFLHTFEPQPIILQLGPLALRWYGLLMVTSMIAGLLIVLRFARQEKIKSDSRVQIIFKAKTSEIVGDKFVTGLKYEDLETNQLKEIKLDGIFVEIGSVPNIEFVKDLIVANKVGEIVIDHKTQATSQEGIWAAGDATDILYKQNNVSAGDAIKAILNIYDYLNRK